MLESQQRLRDELHAHTSLIHPLRCVDANSSAHILGRLRLDDYDSALPGVDLARSHSPGDRVYPWEELDETQRQHASEGDSLPPTDAFPPIRQEGALHPKADHAYDRAADSSQRYPLNIIMPFGMCTGTTAMESSLVHRSQQGLTFQQEMGNEHLAPA